MRLISVAGTVVAAVLTLSGIGVSPAQSFPVECLRAQFDSAGATGNYSNGTCNAASKVAVLKSLFVLGERIIPIMLNLWCVKLVNATPNTGVYLTSACLNGAVKENGEFTEVIYQPQIQTVLAGEAYPIILDGTSVAKGENSISLESSVAQLPARKLSVLLSVAESSSLGTLNATFSGVHEEGDEAIKCNGVGDSEAEGIVLVPGGFQLAETNLTTLELALIATFGSPLVILCDKGALEIAVTAPALSRVVPAEGDSTSIQLASRCTKSGEQELSSYYNEEDTLLTKQLLSVGFGGKKASGCEEVEETVLLALAAESKAGMFTVLY
jgi:hypothetical protein